MATEGKVPPGGDDPLARRIADLNRKLDEVKAAASSAKTAGHLMTLLIVAAAIFGVVTLIAPFYALKDRPEEVKAAMAAEFEAKVQPELMRELKESQEKTGPVVQQIVMTKFRERGPEFVEAFDAESTIFMNNVKGMGQKMWETHIANLDKEIYKRMVERVPDLADHDKVETVVTNAHAAVTSAVERLVTENLKSHVDSITSIQEQLENFPVPTHIKQKTDDELRDAFVEILSTYSTNTLKAGLTPQTRAFLADLGSDPGAGAEADAAAPAADTATQEAK